MRWPRESWPWERSTCLLVIVAVTYIAAAVFYVSIGSSRHLYHAPIDDPSNVPFMLGAQLFTYVPLVAVMLVGLPLVSRLPLRDLGFRAPGPRDIGIGLAGAVTMFVVVLAAGQIVSLFGIKSPEQSVEIFKSLKSTQDRELFILLACVCAPIAEELFFRVFIFGAIRRYAPLPLAAVLAGAIFGLCHISGPDAVSQILAVSVPLAFGGIVLAYTYVTSGCYWSNVIAHGCFNLTSVVGILVLHQT